VRTETCRIIRCGIVTKISNEQLYIYIFLFSVVNSTYRGADKSLARPTSRCILFNGHSISLDASLVICINSTNIPLIVIINRIYETQNLLSLSFFPSWSG
jgi:hypothetical protein